MTVGLALVVEPAKLLMGNAGRETVVGFQPVDAPALLVDRGEERHAGLRLQEGEQFADLRG